MIQKMPILLGGSVPHYAFDAAKIAIILRILQIVSLLFCSYYVILC